MNAIDRPFDRLVAVLCVLIALAIGPSAIAQGVRGRDVLVPPGPSPPLLVTDSQVDHWAFGGLDADEFRSRLERRLTARINEVNRICPLSEAQKKKLSMAGRVEIRRFFDDVAKLKQTIRDSEIDEPFLGNVFRIPQPSQILDPRSLFADDALLGKILKSTLGSEQFARYERIKLADRAARHQGTLKWVVGVLDTSLHLNSEQHRRLAALLAQETRAPRKFGEYDYYGVMFQVSRLPEARVRPIFDAGQWAKLQVHLNEAVRLQNTLEQGGFVPENAVAAKAPAAERNQAIIQPEDDQGS
jgi:hypothetical protein